MSNFDPNFRVELIEDNTDLILKATDDQIERALEIIGSIAEDDAQGLCPVDTGNLRQSITHEVDRSNHEVTIGTAVRYAPHVEYGHKQEAGRYVPAIKKRLKKDFVPAKPYLRPAIQKNIPLFKDVIKEELSN